MSENKSSTSPGHNPASNPASNPAGNPAGKRVLFSGNLASPRRTVTGLMGQLPMAGVPEERIPEIMHRVGLPARAAEDPDFPVSREQELVALGLMLAHLTSRIPNLVDFTLATFSRVGINNYGIQGLAMLHTASALEALKVMLTYAELSWGHSRVVVTRDGRQVVMTFELGAPVPPDLAVPGDQLRQYCVTRDLVSVELLLGDVLGRAVLPLAITLPWPEPVAGDGAAQLPCPVEFSAPEASIRYPLALLDAVPPLAADLPFRRYDKLARGFSSMLADEVTMAEQVSRLLWAYTPAPSRDEVATMLAMGPRTLARKLKAEDTSFNTLLRQMQVERATNYLRDSSLGLAAIGEHMGYSEPAAFTRAFQAWTGEAPSRWRARHRLR